MSEIIAEKPIFKPETQELVNKLVELQKTGTLAIVNGALGDMEHCGAIVEARIEPPEGGSFTKFYGCTYLFKGFPEINIVENLALGKALISMLPRFTISKSHYLKVCFGLLYVFGNKWFWYYAHVYFFMIYRNVVQKNPLSPNKYNKPTKELKRAVDIALNKQIEDHPYYEGATFFRGPLNRVTRMEKYETIACAMEFVYLFLEYDNAYRFRLQDAFAELNKDNIKENVRKEVTRIFDILIEREDPQHGIGKKWRQIKKVIVPFLFVSKFTRTFMRDFLLALDTKEFALDESDRYFCLKRRSHNIGGTTLPERLEEAKLINKEKKHCIVEPAIVTDPKINEGKPTQVLNVSELW